MRFSAEYGKNPHKDSNERSFDLHDKALQYCSRLKFIIRPSSPEVKSRHFPARPQRTNPAFSALKRPSIRTGLFSSMKRGHRPGLPGCSVAPQRKALPCSGAPWALEDAPFVGALRFCTMGAAFPGRDTRDRTRRACSENHGFPVTRVFPLSFFH